MVLETPQDSTISIIPIIVLPFWKGAFHPPKFSKKPHKLPSIFTSCEVLKDSLKLKHHPWQQIPIKKTQRGIQFDH